MKNPLESWYEREEEREDTEQAVAIQEIQGAVGKDEAFSEQFVLFPEIQTLVQEHEKSLRKSKYILDQTNQYYAKQKEKAGLEPTAMEQRELETMKSNIEEILKRIEETKENLQRTREYIAKIYPEGSVPPTIYN